MSSGWRRPVLAAGAFLVGLYVTLQLTTEAIYGAENYQPGAADCDDCGITLLLDNIGWLVLVLLGYVALAGLVARRHMSSTTGRGAG